MAALVRAIVVAALLAVLSACGEQPRAATTAAPQTAGPEFTDVRLGGRTFRLELALDEQTRFRGLSGRTAIDPNGGMLFVFPRPRELYFVMRDCPIPIDIIFLDGGGRVTATHQMKIEPPRRSGESDEDYEDRLTMYPSRFSAQYAIELAGGTLPGLHVREGDKVEVEDALKARAR